MKKTFFAIISLILASCTAQAADYKVVFSYDKYQEERAKVYKMFRNDFEKEKEVRRAMKLPEQEPSIGIDAYDLNGDGKKEIFVLFRSSYFCGGSRCKMEIFENTGSGLKAIFDVYVNDAVVVASTVSNGFRDILIGSGVTDNRKNIWRWNGKEYAHSAKASSDRQVIYDPEDYCPPSPELSKLSLSYWFENEKAIFVGEAKKIDVRAPESIFSVANRCWVTFDVKEWLKKEGDFIGKDGNNVVVSFIYNPYRITSYPEYKKELKDFVDEANCPIIRGEKYLVYANYFKTERHKYLYAPLRCNPSTKLEDALDDVDAFRRYTQEKGIRP